METSFTAGAAGYRVAPLTYKKSDYNASTNPNPYKAYLNFASTGTVTIWGLSYGVQPANNHWTFSGCGVTPTTSDEWNPHVVCTTTGELSITVHCSGSYNTMPYEGDYSFKAYVVGGAIEIESDKENNPREMMVNSTPDALQPWKLYWFGYKATEIAPTGLQPTTVLTVKPSSFTQPDGCTTSWELYGPIEKTDGLAGKILVTPKAPSMSRGDATVRQKFTMTVDGTTYSFYDCSSGKLSNTDTPDAGAYTITVHKPTEIVLCDGKDDDPNGDRPPLETAKKEVLTHDANGNVTNADMAYKRAYALEVRGQFHDPLDGVEVAERFPAITFDSTFTQQEQAFLTTAMNATGHWDTGIDVHLWLCTDPSHLDPYDYGAEPNNLLHAKFWDENGFVWNASADIIAAHNLPRHRVKTPASGGTPEVENDPLAVFHQEFYAGTHVKTINGPGILIGKFQLKEWTDAVRRMTEN